MLNKTQKYSNAFINKFSKKVFCRQSYKPDFERDLLLC